MKRRTLLLGLAATACAPRLRAALPGRFEAEGASVTLPSAWSVVPETRNDLTNAVALTRHGLRLGRLDIARLAPGQALTRTESAPRFARGFSAPALIDFTPESFNAAGYGAMRAENPRRVTIDAAEGMRVDLFGFDPRGLAVTGDALLAEADGALHIVSFLAPATHYHPAYRAEVAAIFASLRLS